MSSAPPKYLTGDKAGIREFIQKFDVFLFDCDGVLWSGEHVFEGTVETLEMLRSQGKRLVFVTNNSTKSRADYKKKFEGLGIPVEIGEIFPSSYISAIYISHILSLPPSASTVFILGESGIETELSALSLPFIGGTDPLYRRAPTPSDYTSLASGTALNPSVGVVLCGLDPHINYLKLMHAYHYLRRGAIFLATNIDTSFPSAGALFPGAGACVAPLVAMLGREPTALGKPSTAMLDAVEGALGGLDRGRVCMVGDRLDTDIRFGREGGLGGTLAVLTGVVGRGEVEGEGENVPMAFVDGVGDLRLGG